MRNDIKDLIMKNNHCVLATVSGNRPYCSLMSYAVDESCRELYMITLMQSHKYSNLLNNPGVSLLIDTREEDAGDRRSAARALTISGIFQKIEDQQKKEEVKNQLIATHPHLREIAAHPDAEPFAVKLEKLLLLQGVNDAYFENAD